MLQPPLASTGCQPSVVTFAGNQLQITAHSPGCVSLAAAVLLEAQAKIGCHANVMPTRTSPEHVNIIHDENLVPGARIELATNPDESGLLYNPC
jgi:hypothetical protein